MQALPGVELQEAVPDPRDLGEADVLASLGRLPIHRWPPLDSLTIGGGLYSFGGGMAMAGPSEAMAFGIPERDARLRRRASAL
jgi:hypothetical protein